MLEPGDCVSLDGPLGAGKTRLVRGIVAGAGISTRGVNSPTYVIAQEYESQGATASQEGRVVRIVHVDAYRLRGVDELETVGWDALTAAGGGIRPVLLVEWAERIEPALPSGVDRCRIRIWHADGGPDGDRREFEIQTPDAWRGRRGWVALEAVCRELSSGGSPASDEPSVGRGSTVCPITGKVVPPDSPTYPFADERARLADLSRWLSGGYVVSRELTAEDIEEEQPGGSSG